MMGDNIHRLLPIRAAHPSLGAQGSHWALVTEAWLTAVWLIPISSPSRDQADTMEPKDPIVNSIVGISIWPGPRPRLHQSGYSEVLEITSWEPGTSPGPKLPLQCSGFGPSDLLSSPFIACLLFGLILLVITSTGLGQSCSRRVPWVHSKGQGCRGRGRSMASTGVAMVARYGLITPRTQHISSHLCTTCGLFSTFPPLLSDLESLHSSVKISAPPPPPREALLDHPQQRPPSEPIDDQAQESWFCLARCSAMGR